MPRIGGLSRPSIWSGVSYSRGVKNQWIKNGRHTKFWWQMDKGV